MRPSSNYTGAIRDNLREVKLLLNEIELALDNEADFSRYLPNRFWPTIENTAGFLAGAAGKLRDNARDAALISEFEAEAEES